MHVIHGVVLQQTLERLEEMSIIFYELFVVVDGTQNDLAFDGFGAVIWALYGGRVLMDMHPCDTTLPRKHTMAKKSHCARNRDTSKKVRWSNT